LIHNTTEIGLFFAVGATHNEKCCGTDISKSGKPSAQGCRIAKNGTTAEADCNPNANPSKNKFHIMMKLIANPYIFDNFSTADPETSTFNKGIRMVNGLNFMNGETTDKGCWENNSIATDSDHFCSNNDDSHFVSYVNANNSNDDYAGFYNHWYKRTDNTTSTDYWELLFACTTRVLDKKICGAVNDPSPNSTAISGFF